MRVKADITHLCGLIVLASLGWAMLHSASVAGAVLLFVAMGATAALTWRAGQAGQRAPVEQPRDELAQPATVETSDTAAGEAALRGNAAFREFAFESLRIPVVVMDAATWQYVDCNPAAVAIYGFASREEVVGKAPVDVSTAVQYDGRPSAEVAGERIRQALTDGSLVFEWRHQRPTGEVWDSEVRLMAFRAGERQLLQFTLEDITASKQAAELLEQERVFTNAVMDSVPGLLYLYDAEGHLVRWNKQHELLTGFSADELNGKQVLTWYDEPDRSRIIEAIGEVYQTGRSSAEIHLLTKDRGPVPFLVTGQRLTLAGQEYLTGIGIELTERRVAEKARQQSQDELDRILRTVPDIIYRLDTQGRITFINEAVRAYGYDPSAMLGQTMLEFVAREDRARALHRLDERRTGDRATKSFELRLLPADGPERTFEVRSDALDQTPVFLVDASGLYSTERPTTASFLGTQGIARDITQRKRAEEALRESEEKFRSLFVQAADASYLIQDERYIDCNDEALRLYDSDRAGIIGSTPADWSPEYQSDGQPSAAGATAHMAQALRDGHCRFAWTHRRQDGSPVETEVTLTCVGLAGQPVLFASVRDVTGERQSERERAKLQAQLTQAQKMESVGRLAGGVAHDFNNMLNVVYGHAEMALLEVPADSPVHRDLEEIYTAAKRSADLTRQLLAFARQEVVSPQVLNLNEAITPMLQLLRRLIGEDIDLVWKPAAALPPIHIDLSQVDQLLANLSVNARDAIAGVGTLVIETSRIALDEEFCTAHGGLKPGPYVLLAVSDDGCGMDKETAERIFEPFFTTKIAGEGTGLGLSTVYGIVKQNNGAVTVYSEPGQGTTFRVYFPALPDVPTRRQALATAAPQLGGSETLLLVEDEAPILRVAQRTLTRLGYTVLAAHTPAEAIELATEHPGDLDLLITDVVMPGMNGRDLATQLVTLRPGLRVLFMSGYTADVIGRHGVLDAETPFIAKPFTTASLASKVREVLKQA